MPEFITINNSPDFFKDFIIEDPATIVADAKDKIEQDKEKLEKEKLEPVKNLEELQKELEADAEKEITEEKKEEDKSKEDESKNPKKEEKKEDDEVEYSFKPFIDTMIEHGILDEGEEEIGESAEDLVEAFETTVTNRVVTGIDEYKESIPELGKQFLEYLEKGGDPKRFIKAQSGPIDFTNIDLTEESNQEVVIREYLKIQGYTAEEIKDTIKDYKEGVILENQAKLASKKLEKFQEKQTELLIREQEAQVKEQEKAITEYVTNVQKIIKDSKTLAGLELSDKDRKEFEPYLFKKGKDGLTQYQRDLGENPILTQAELAFLKFKKYDFAKATKKGESEAARKIREKVISKTETTVKGSTADTANKSDFSAFEKMMQSMRKQ